MRAMSALIREAGMSTRVCLAVTALRIRVSMSAIGSVISTFESLDLVIWWSSGFRSLNHHVARSPTTLRDPCHVAFKRQLAETQPAQRELPHVCARAAAQVASVAQPNLVLRLLLFLRDLRSGGHSVFSHSGGPCPPVPNSCPRAGTACRRTAAACALPRRSSQT